MDRKPVNLSDFPGYTSQYLESPSRSINPSSILGNTPGYPGTNRYSNSPSIRVPSGPLPFGIVHTIPYNNNSINNNNNTHLNPHNIQYSLSKLNIMPSSPMKFEENYHQQLAKRISNLQSELIRERAQNSVLLTEKTILEDKLKPEENYRNPLQNQSEIQQVLLEKDDLIRRLAEELESRSNPSVSYEQHERDNLMRNFDQMHQTVIDLENKSAMIATQNERLHLQLKERDKMIKELQNLSDSSKSDQQYIDRINDLDSKLNQLLDENDQMATLNQELHHKVINLTQKQSFYNKDSFREQLESKSQMIKHHLELEIDELKSHHQMELDLFDSKNKNLKAMNGELEKQIHGYLNELESHQFKLIQKEQELEQQKRKNMMLDRKTMESESLNKLVYEKTERINELEGKLAVLLNDVARLGDIAELNGKEAEQIREKFDRCLNDMNQSHQVNMQQTEKQYSIKLQNERKKYDQKIGQLERNHLDDIKKIQRENEEKFEREQNNYDKLLHQLEGEIRDLEDKFMAESRQKQSQFKKVLDEREKQIQALQEQVQSLIEEMSGNVKLLEEKFKDNSDFRALESRYQEAKNEKFRLEEEYTLLISRNLDLEQQIDIFIQGNDKLNESLNQRLKEIDQYQQKFIEMVDENEQNTAQLIEKHETEVDKKDQKINQLTQELGNLKQNLQDRNQEIRDLTDNFNEIKQDYQRNVQTIVQRDQDYESFKQDFIEKEKQYLGELREKNKVIHDLETKIMILNEGEVDVKELKQELLSAKNDLLEQQTQNLNLQQRNSDLSSQLENLKKELSDIEDIRKECEEKNKNLKNNIENLKKLYEQQMEQKDEKAKERLEKELQERDQREKEKLRRIQSSIQKLNMQYDQNQRKLEEEIENLKRKLVSMEQRAEANEREAKGSRSTREELQHQQRNAKAGFLKLEADVSALRAQNQSLKYSVSKLQQDLFIQQQEIRDIMNNPELSQSEENKRLQEEIKKLLAEREDIIRRLNSLQNAPVAPVQLAVPDYNTPIIKHLQNQVETLQRDRAIMRSPSFQNIPPPPRTDRVLQPSMMGNTRSMSSFQRPFFMQEPPNFNLLQQNERENREVLEKCRRLALL